MRIPFIPLVLLAFGTALPAHAQQSARTPLATWPKYTLNDPHPQEWSLPAGDRLRIRRPPRYRHIHAQWDHLFIVRDNWGPKVGAWAHHGRPGAVIGIGIRF